MYISRMIAMLTSVKLEYGDLEVRINSSRSGHKDAEARAVGVMMEGLQKLGAQPDYCLIMDWPKQANPHKFGDTE